MMVTALLESTDPSYLNHPRHEMDPFSNSRYLPQEEKDCVEGVERWLQSSPLEDNDEHFKNRYIAEYLELKLDLEHLTCCAILKEHEKSITSLDFDDLGNWSLTAGKDDKLILYDIENTKKLLICNVLKYGAGLAKFTHAPYHILHTVTKNDPSQGIRYLDINKNSYIRYFKVTSTIDEGHTQPVILLDMHPQKDLFFSGSYGEKICLWDIRASSSHPEASLKIAYQPLVAWDPSGLVFAIADDNKTIRLFDHRNLSAGPFQTWDIQSKLSNYYGTKRPDGNHIQDNMILPLDPWAQLSWSDCGNFIYLGTTGKFHYIFNSFTGKLLQCFSGHQPTNSKELQFSGGFCPTLLPKPTLASQINPTTISNQAINQAMFYAGVDGHLHIWNAFTAKEIVIYDCNSLLSSFSTNFDKVYPSTSFQSKITFASWNPRFRLFAITNGPQLSFWHPEDNHFNYKS